MDFGTEIKEFLRGQGVDYIGFDAAAPFSGWEDIFRKRCDDGLVPSRYEKKLKADPRTILPGARSLIVFGFRYPGFYEEPDPTFMSVCGISMARKMERKISAMLVGFVNEKGHRAVDGQGTDEGIPVKAAAVRAGFAIQRKNTIVYTEYSGSAVRLGTVVTDMDLEPEEAAEMDPCGECDLCLEACPTGALVDEHTLDISRCICYLTEIDGDIPVGLRPAIGNRMLGCELCQTVCPYNRDIPVLSSKGIDWLALRSLAEEAIERPEALVSNLREDHEFVFHGTRAPVRNVAIALGNWGDPEAVPLLHRLQESKWPEVVNAARWALEQIES